MTDQYYYYEAVMGTGKKIHLFAHDGFVVVIVIGHVLDDCDVSFLMSILVRLRAACTMRGLALYFGCLRLWCCQFGVVIA